MQDVAARSVALLSLALAWAAAVVLPGASVVAEEALDAQVAAEAEPDALAAAVVLVWVAPFVVAAGPDALVPAEAEPDA